MPTRRRPGPVVAAKLLASRLPVGTPTHPQAPAERPLGSPTKPGSVTSNRGAARLRQSSAQQIWSSSPRDTSDNSDMSLADIRLDRQRKRNEAAEASMNAAVTAPARASEKRQTSRVKSKWKPFDYANDTAGGVPVERRINTYSRTSSLSRPVSALSHRTDDSAFSDGSGFQLLTGRKGRRHPGELRQATSDKPQTTVEATFDKREIYEVFGNALPGPEYLEQNVGFKNGQIQFLQHPNGDVSAQQWSAQRYEWANVGQFSNIRKKVEGQLASDRLKGEMAHHTLQQNTLQYFRTIAKQREAMVMGLPFGPKDVEAALPMTARAVPHSSEAEHQPAVQTPSHPPPGHSERHASEATKASSERTAAERPRSPLPANVPREPATDRWEVTGAKGSVHAYDPFYSSNAPASSAYASGIYGTSSSYETSGSTVHGYTGMSQTPYKMPQGYVFPPVAVPAQFVQSPGAQKYFAERAAIANRMQSQWRQVYGSQPTMTPYAQQYYHYRGTASDGQQHASRDYSSYETTTARDIVAPQPRSINSVDRSAMRNTLYKLGETAKERNLSQANIRTVLHDPFQSSPEVGRQEDGNSVNETNQFTSPVQSKKTVVQPSSLPSLRDQRRYMLQESSPDTQWTKRPREHSTPLQSKPSSTRATSHAITGHVDHSSYQQQGRAVEAATKTYEDHLNEWWIDSSRAARHEDLYQAIVAAQAAEEQFDSPPAHLTPIGPPSRHPGNTAAAKTSFNESATRMLIPMLENLTSYVEGPVEKRRDYWSQWGPAPEWCIDRSPEGNNSFFDATDLGDRRERTARDMRYGSSFDQSTLETGGDKGKGWRGMDSRFANAGLY